METEEVVNGVKNKDKNPTQNCPFKQYWASFTTTKTYKKPFHTYFLSISKVMKSPQLVLSHIIKNHLCQGKSECLLLKSSQRGIEKLQQKKI